MKLSVLLPLFLLSLAAPRALLPLWRATKASKDMQPMLINLRDDPGEQTDLSAKEPAKAQALQKLFVQWNATMQPPRWEAQRWNGAENREEEKRKKKGRK